MRLKTFFNRALQWLKCQLHGNELPLRRLMEYIDGPISGPTGFNDPIGKILTGCKTLPVVNCVAVDGAIQNMPAIDGQDLSTDQSYLLEIFKAVFSGDSGYASLTW